MQPKNKLKNPLEIFYYGSLHGTDRQTRRPPPEHMSPLPCLPDPPPLSLCLSGGSLGGIWRCAYKIDSLGEAAALLYLLLETPGGLLFLTSVIVALVAVFVHFLPQIQQLAEQHLLPLLNKQ